MGKNPSPPCHGRTVAAVFGEFSRPGKGGTTRTNTYDNFLARRKHPAVQDVGRVDSPKTPLGTSCEAVRESVTGAAVQS